jgi:pimeloyl-ACP methyl ester carboxylesterase
MRIVLFLVIAAALGAPALVVAQDQFFDSNGVRIHYREAGAGETVVLIHGLGNSLESAWIATGVISALARDHRVIAFDSRGHGKSGKPSDPGAYGLEMPRDVLRLLDHLKVRRAHVVGYSQGGVSAGKLLAINPDRVITASFVGAPARLNWGEADEKFAAAQVAQFREDPPFRSQILRGVPAVSPRRLRMRFESSRGHCSLATTPRR